MKLVEIDDKGWLERKGYSKKILLNDKELCQKLRTKALSRSKAFSWLETARKTVQVYEDVYHLSRE